MMIGTYGLGIAQVFNEYQTVRRLHMPVGHDKIDRPLTQNDQRLLDVFGLCESAHPQTFTQVLTTVRMNLLSSATRTLSA
ncbi:MAG: hypothetical protein OSB76_06750 [Alphaproteobacteria bacterium]|nr:hypothetical protein [Alphaproteobacteria bacterium]